MENRKINILGTEWNIHIVKEFPEPGWWYMDLDGVWHHASGVSPKMPMYTAGKELRDKVVRIAREVFES